MMNQHQLFYISMDQGCRPTQSLRVLCVYMYGWEQVGDFWGTAHSYNVTVNGECDTCLHACQSVGAVRG